jgi:hypothetical protein
VTDKVLEIPRLPQFELARLIEKRPREGAQLAEVREHTADQTEYLRQLNVCLVEWWEEWAASINSTITIINNGGDLGVYKEFANGLLTGSNAVLYTVPADKTAVIKDIWLTNKDSTDRDATIYRVPSGGVAGDSNAIINGVPVTGPSGYQMTGSLVLHEGGTIEGFASTTNLITYTITGLLYDA